MDSPLPIPPRSSPPIASIGPIRAFPMRNANCPLDRKPPPMPRLPFEVTVWVKKTDAFPALRDELIGLAVEEPNGSTEYEGIVDLHWRFDNLKEAESVAEALTVLRARAEIVLLRLSNDDDLDASISYKDERNV